MTNHHRVVLRRRVATAGLLVSLAPNVSDHPNGGFHNFRNDSQSVEDAVSLHPRGETPTLLVGLLVITVSNFKQNGFAISCRSTKCSVL